jgi:glycosyltransferase involved in cell wall biosynthesis
MSQGVPVVVSRTRIDTFYFDDSVVRFFPSGDDEAMAEAMLELIECPALRESLIASAREYVARNGWDQRKNEYIRLVDTLSTETFDTWHPVRQLRPQLPERSDIRPTHWE